MGHDLGWSVGLVLCWSSFHSDRKGVGVSISFDLGTRCSAGKLYNVPPLNWWYFQIKIKCVFIWYSCGVTKYIFRITYRNSLWGQDAFILTLWMPWGVYARPMFKREYWSHIWRHMHILCITWKIQVLPLKCRKKRVDTMSVASAIGVGNLNVFYVFIELFEMTVFSKKWKRTRKLYFRGYILFFIVLLPGHRRPAILFHNYTFKMKRRNEWKVVLILQEYPFKRIL